MKQIFLAAALVLSLSVHSQNNDIFNGGNADGWNQHAYAQPVANIFSGGNGDGWNYNTYAQTLLNIFNGGNGDGWVYNAYAQPVDSLFNGGEGDGWTYQAFAQSGNSIFGGGEGDGWASTYRPLGPLPVTWIDFTAVKQGKTSLLKWQTASEQNSAYFDIERKALNGDFIKIGTTPAAGHSDIVSEYTFTDMVPFQGVNFYRIKQADADGRFTYTPVRVVNFDGVKEGRLLIWPVPAITRLVVSLPEIFNGRSSFVTVTNAEGKTVQKFTQQSLSSGQLFDIDVTRLPAGTYYLRVTSGDKIASASFVKL